MHDCLPADGRLIFWTHQANICLFQCFIQPCVAPFDFSTARKSPCRQCMFVFGVLVFFLFPTIASSLSCLYYRVRADEPLTPYNAMTRNCSSLVYQCVKIIHKTESEEYYHVDSYIEGRCAYSKEECDKPRSCFPEEPRKQSGFTTREYKCCSNEDLSNGGQTMLWYIVLIVLQVQQLLLE